eukprot:1788767-Rhodomonas_salina.1
MSVRKDRLKALEESDSESESSHRSSRSLGTSLKRNATKATSVDKETPSKQQETATAMESISEGLGEASLSTLIQSAAAMAATNPNEETNRRAHDKSKTEELANIQSRLPFVQRRPFSLEGVSDSDKASWLPNLLSVISKTARVVSDNLSLISGGELEAATEDGSGPMDGLNLLQVVLMWGSTWDKAEEATSMDRAVAKLFMVRQEEKGLVFSMELKAPMAWKLACMEPVDEKTTALVFAEMAAAKMENMEKNELFVHYIRASAFS